jgi:hypothetical protein
MASHCYHLPKHVAVNLEYSNKSTNSLTHLLVILQRDHKVLGPTIKMLTTRIYATQLVSTCRNLEF